MQSLQWNQRRSLPGSRRGRWRLDFRLPGLPRESQTGQSTLPIRRDLEEQETSLTGEACITGRALRFIWHRVNDWIWRHAWIVFAGVAGPRVQSIVPRIPIEGGSHG